MNKIICPKCGSTNVQEQAEFAARRDDGQLPRKPHVAPNCCREENCLHKWYNKE